MPGMWLFWASWRKVLEAVLLYENVYVSWYLTRATKTVNIQGSDKDWYLTNWNKYTNTESCHL